MPAEIVIRRARPDEINAVPALVQAIADETFVGLFATPHVPIGEAHWFSAWLAISNDEIVGVTMTREEWVNDLWIRRDSRRLGIGARLLAHAEREIRARGHGTFRLRVVKSNVRAVQFYQSRGWKVYREFPHEKFGHAMFEMTKHSSQFFASTSEGDMPDASDKSVLEALLDSWDRNNTMLVNLLRAVPKGGLEARAMEGSPSVAEMLTHIHYVRLVFVSEDAPEFARPMPKEEWAAERHPGRIADMLNESAKVVREAVRGRLAAGREMDLHYDHPILFLQHMIWHEGYHHGQIKLALKLAGRPVTDEDAGPVTWGVWMRKTK